MRGERAVFIPLVRPAHVKKEVPDLAGSVEVGTATRGPATLFAALTLPLVGMLGEDEFTSIEPGENTSAVERAFGMPAQDFAGQVLRGDFTVWSYRHATPEEKAQWVRVQVGRRVELEPTAEQVAEAKVSLRAYNLGGLASRWKSGVVVADLGDRWQVSVDAGETTEIFKGSPRLRRALDAANDVRFAEPVGGCFVHPRIYAAMALHNQGPTGRDEWSAWNATCLLTPPVLQSMGFVRGETSERERYNVAWRHPKYPKITLWSDGRWCELQGPRGLPGCYTPRELAATLEGHGGGPRKFDPKTRSRMRATAALNFHYDEGVEAAREARRTVERGKRYGIDRVGYLGLEGNNMFGYGLDPGFVDRFWPEIESGTLKAEAVGFWTFLRNMAAINRLLMPAYSGTRDGNARAHRSLARLALDILDRKARRRG